MTKILIVEDEALIRSRLSEEFDRDGFDVVEASDGEEGLKKAQTDNPDVILLDIILPKMHGLNVLKKLHEDEATKKIPVILLTNLSDSTTISKALESGAYDFLVKENWTLDQVVRRVKEKINK